MGMVGLTLNIMLESPDVDVTTVKAAIEKIAQPKQVVEKPVAFGLKMLEVLLVFDDKKGADMAAIEEQIRQIDGVSSVESGDVTLIS